MSIISVFTIVLILASNCSVENIYLIYAYFSFIFFILSPGLASCQFNRIFSLTALSAAWIIRQLLVEEEEGKKNASLDVTLAEQNIIANYSKIS